MDHLRCYTPHTAFSDPRSPLDAPPRNSCEVRCICWYDESGEYTNAFDKLNKKKIGMISNRVKRRVENIMSRRSNSKL